MGKTFDQSLIDTANIPMSMIDPEDMQDTSSEEFNGLRRIQQGCHSELCNREDFPFNKYTMTIATTANVSEYQAPLGTITNIWVKGDSESMPYTPEIEFLGASKGKPATYGIRNNPERLVFYPTPDKVFNINIAYNDTKNVIDTLGNETFIITIGSTLKMPERVQHLYFDALEYRVLFEYMRKMSNPRWQPTEQLFNEKWKVFLKACKPTDSETYFVI
jgi:hypothetical protein